MKKYLSVFFLILACNSIMKCSAQPENGRVLLMIDGCSKLGKYTSLVTKSINVFELLLNSKEFQDSIKENLLNINFTEVRGKCPNSKILNIESRADSIYFRADTILLQLLIKKQGKKHTKTMGSSSYKKNIIKSYDWWFRQTPDSFIVYYVSHIAHEFSHIRGFCHYDKVSCADKNKCPCYNKCKENCTQTSSCNKSFPYFLTFYTREFLKSHFKKENDKFLLIIDGKIYTIS